MIEIKNPQHFFQIQQEKFPFIPYPQSRAWYNYLISRNEKIVFYLDHEKDTKVAFWGRVKKIPLISSNILLIDTPVVQPELTEKSIRNRFLTLTEIDYAGIEIDSISEYNIEFEIGIRRAGFVRPLGIYKCPLSIKIDLAKPFNFDSKWKRNVTKSQSAGVIIKEIKNPTFNDAILFCDVFNQTKEIKNLKYSLKAENIYALLNNTNIRLFNAIDNQEVVSCQVVYFNNKYCYSILRVNSYKSRINNAAYLLYNQVFKTLAVENYLTCDMGRIPPSNNDTDSVYSFKKSSGGKKIQYTGEWAFYKNKRIEYLMFFYKDLILKKQRY